MHVYFSGIGGAGLSPLAQLALDCGFKVGGSDLEASTNTALLAGRGIKVQIGQSGQEIAKVHRQKPIDWVVFSSAVAEDHPEVTFARRHGIRISKRDELINYIVRVKNLQLLAVTGTHGKTTAAAMLAWCFKQLGEPLSYSIGTNVAFGRSAEYQPASKYFVYEADEFDRNFLHFEPFVSLIMAVDYDHPDTYPTTGEYLAAFRQFAQQSQHVFTWQEIADLIELADIQSQLHLFGSSADIETIKLTGEHNRKNGFLVVEALKFLFPDKNEGEILRVLSKYPGSQRRMEKLLPRLYSDYAHHPVEIAATLELAHELGDNVVAVYQPHQNIRQHRLADLYRDCFAAAERVYWLPTHLSREDPSLPVLTPQELIARIKQPAHIEPAELDEQLLTKIREHLDAGDTVIAMGAGSIDPWLRSHLGQLPSTARVSSGSL